MCAKIVLQLRHQPWPWDQKQKLNSTGDNKQPITIQQPRTEQCIFTERTASLHKLQSRKTLWNTNTVNLSFKRLYPLSRGCLLSTCLLQQHLTLLHGNILKLLHCYCDNINHRIERLHWYTGARCQTSVLLSLMDASVIHPLPDADVSFRSTVTARVQPNFTFFRRRPCRE